MKPSDLVLYLFGHRGAIERVAAARHGWLIGAILVITAGIARNYDHLDLLRQPEWFIGPFAASLVSICFIFLWISGPLKLRSAGSHRRQAGTFLVLAWLTAPCAWLYGIPAETMTDILTATKWNVAFLAIVSLWRVAIIVRAVSVLAEVSWLRVLPLVLAPAALEAALGSFFQGISLVGIMGGVRLPPETELLVAAARFTNSVSIWLFAACVIAGFLIKGIARSPLFRPTRSEPKSLIPATLAALLAWLVPAAAMHPAMANRHQLQTLIDCRDYVAVVAFASGKTRGDFPRHHYLPPEPARWFPPKLLDALPENAPGWLREQWVENAIESLKMSDSHQREEWQETFRRYPEIPQAIARHAAELRGRSDRLDREETYWLRHYDRVSGEK